MKGKAANHPSLQSKYTRWCVNSLTYGSSEKSARAYSEEERKRGLFDNRIRSPAAPFLRVKFFPGNHTAVPGAPMPSVHLPFCCFRDWILPAAEGSPLPGSAFFICPTQSPGTPGRRCTGWPAAAPEGPPERHPPWPPVHTRRDSRKWAQSSRNGLSLPP